MDKRGAVKRGTISRMAFGSVVGVTSRRYDRSQFRKAYMSKKNKLIEDANRAGKLKKTPRIMGCWERPAE